MKFKFKIMTSKAVTSLLSLIMNMRIHVIALLLCSLNCSAENNFKNIFDLAKHSSCKDAAEKLMSNELEISNLKSKVQNSLFPWRFEVTNGYQEGFVYYALLGYANELNEDIPFAYRCYQNSLACIDEDKSFDYPLPRAEIYLAIGRTCLAAGRYVDSKDWLDNAFLEVGDNKQLQAAIDRVLIQRANEIGDYPEIIFLYQHLENLANKKTPILDKEGCPKGGVVERVTVHGLRKTDYVNYAQILFYSRKDREGFGKLLAGISNGIDNNLGVKDPLVDMFLNNIMRADDDEIKYFYDLLGWAIVDARAKEGDENYLAFLCNARTLFCKVYDFLEPEDDLEKVKKRIDDVKRQLAQGYDVFGKESRPATRGPRPVRNRKIIKSPNFNIKNSKVESTPGIILEDLLMQADWCRRQKCGQKAWNFYISAMNLITNNVNLQLVYDNVKPRFAVESGKALLALDYWYGSRLCGYKVTNYTEIISIPLKQAYGDSLRHCIFYSTAYLCFPYDDFPTVLPEGIRDDLYQLVCNNSPLALPALKRVFKSNINQAIFFGEYEKAEKECKKIEHRFGIATQNQYQLWGGLYLLRGELKSAFAVWFRGAILTRNVGLLSLCKAHISWASNEHLEEFSKILKAFGLSSCIKRWPAGITRLRSALEWNSTVGKTERKLRHLITEANWDSALHEIKNNYSKVNVSDYQRTSTILLKLGHTNDAVQASLKELQNRMTFLNAGKINYLILPNSDSKLIISCLTNASFDTQNKYFQWLSILKNKAVKKRNRLSGPKLRKSKICAKKIYMLNKYISLLENEINQVVDYVPGVTNNLSGTTL